MLLSEPLRLLSAAVVVLMYTAGCIAVWQRERQRRRRAAADAAALGPAASGAVPVLVAYASQTGRAEQLAWQTARSLHNAGLAVHLRPLGDVTAQELAQASRALLIASSYGEGDPPDTAAGFARRVMQAEQAPALHGLRYATLALGDRSYARFCGFGRSLHTWLAQCGATPLFERIDVDSADPLALAQWHRQLAQIAGKSATELQDRRDPPVDPRPGSTDPRRSEPRSWEGPGNGASPDTAAPSFGAWHLASRRQVNAGSSGAPLFELELVPPQGQALPDWESGDLLQVRLPADPARPRDYSVASTPAQRGVHLLVRQERHADGSLGLASGWLTAHARPGDTIDARLRPQANFRLGANAARPILFIGNGSGLAGLRGHLHARAQQRAGPNWLLFGERQAAFDRPYRADIDTWLAHGVLSRADLVFSRDPPQRGYVQDRLRECANDVRDWIARDGAVYVCGSLRGMGQGVHAALADVLGAQALEQLAQAGRYRRDVY